MYRPITRGRPSPTWWIAYWYRGREVRESSGSTRETVARRMLRDRLSDKDRGHAFVPRGERTTFEDLAAMLKEDYVVNERRSLDRALRAIEISRLLRHDRR
jgi:hypothetical protein